MHVLECVNLFFAGLLAGAELVVRFGVRAPLAALDERPQIRLRQALIRTLRVVVPSLYVPAALTGIAVTVWNASGTGFALQCVALSAVLVWTVATFGGTVPINEGILEWRADAPPADWRAIVHRWERLDTVRSWAAAGSFAFFLAAVARQLT
ncbi:DUF1772 domain-containing protein [Streptomyces sp. NBC_01476]|uniref:anthrone oxygenase family protein n=1 Tax=Streptomyces sp. NBC_01476 TaxID=2903881 RepID=UPI002E35F421|nr:anthrone oxygenase family protein [Streptomyces sp. NBC_01476]